MTTIADDASAQPDKLLQLIRDKAAPRDIVLALSDERDLWHSRSLRAEALAFDAGYAAGLAEGERRTIERIADDQRRAADQSVSVHVTPDYATLLKLRYAPPGWDGEIPAGMDAAQARQWLARLGRAGDFRPSMARMARLARQAQA